MIEHNIKLVCPAQQEKSEIHEDENIDNRIVFLIFVPAVVFTLTILLLFSCLFFHLSFLKIIFFITAGISIYVYGRYAFEIHNIPATTFKDKKWFLYNQYWLNGLGAFVGWSALYILLFHRIGIEYPHWHFFYHLGWEDFILALVAFVGITGHFPYVVLMGKLPGKIS